MGITEILAVRPQGHIKCTRYKVSGVFGREDEAMSPSGQIVS